MSYKYDLGELFHFSFPFKIQYRDVNGYRPYINCEFEYTGESIYLPMLLDTGADSVLLPIDFMDLFDVRQSEVKSTVMIHGSTQVRYVRNFVVRFPDIDDAFSYNLDVGFTDGLPGRSFGLLGRKILDTIHLCFTHVPDEAYYLSFSGPKKSTFE